jgi:hypothetical protein
MNLRYLSDSKQIAPPPPDRRSLQDKYRHLREAIVDLRVDHAAQRLQIAEIYGRIRKLEAVAVLDLFAEDVRP